MNISIERLFEFLRIAIPAIIAGISAFLLARYNYSKNRPLDKIEIAYNRIYYPIYRIVHKADYKSCIESIEKIDSYLNKYQKYADRSTVVAFNYFKECASKKNAKRIQKAYRSFNDNIHSKCSYIRRRLGYLEPSILSLYAYSTPTEKRTIRILVELFTIYLSIYLINIQITQQFGGATILIAIVFLIFDGTFAFIHFISTGVIKIIEERKDRRVVTK